MDIKIIVYVFAGIVLIITIIGLPYITYRIYIEEYKEKQVKGKHEKSNHEKSYICNKCGYKSNKWLALCPTCKSFDTMQEENQNKQQNNNDVSSIIFWTIFTIIGLILMFNGISRINGNSSKSTYSSNTIDVYLHIR